MTREETKKAILIMQAYVDGKEIECRIDTGAFLISQEPDWCWNGSLCEYRIKEEPGPFEWRGKNIQWVSNGYPRKVIDLGESGVMITGPTLSGFDILDWDFLMNSFNHWQWSEDNATWRKFE